MEGNKFRADEEAVPVRCKRMRVNPLAEVSKTRR